MILSNTELEGIIRQTNENIGIISRYLAENPSHRLYDISGSLRDLSANSAVISEYIKSIAPLINGSAIKASNNESDISLLLAANQSMNANLTKITTFLTDWIAASYTQSNQIFNALNSLAVMQESQQREFEQIQKSLCEIGDNLELEAIFDGECKLLLQYLVHVSPKPGNLNNNNSKNNNSGKAIKSLSQAVE